jgi:two-component system, sensor histidine kinase and response regulator
MNLGADDYLTKPFTRQELLGAIATRLRLHETFTRQSQEKLEALRLSITQSLPHELRTPLNGIIGASQFLIDSYDILDAEDVQEMVQDINTSAHRLHRLILNFLLYAELELITRDPEKRDRLRREQVPDVVPIITESAQTWVKQYHSDRQADLQLDLAPAAVAIAANSLHKIILELVDNACKFSTAGQPVQVRGQIMPGQIMPGQVMPGQVMPGQIMPGQGGGDHYRLQVRDLGRGMSAEQCANLGAYQQFDRKLYEQQGSGLGLAIVTQMVKLHGGNWAIASDLSTGTTVTLNLPLAPQASPACA